MRALPTRTGMSPSASRIRSASPRNALSASSSRRLSPVSAGIGPGGCRPVAPRQPLRRDAQVEARQAPLEGREAAVEVAQARGDGTPNTSRRVRTREGRHLRPGRRVGPFAVEVAVVVARRLRPLPAELAQPLLGLGRQRVGRREVVVAGRLRAEPLAAAVRVLDVRSGALGPAARDRHDEEGLRLHPLERRREARLELLPAQLVLALRPTTAASPSALAGRRAAGARPTRGTARRTPRRGGCAPSSPRPTRRARPSRPR